MLWIVVLVLCCGSLFAQQKKLTIDLKNGSFAQLTDLIKKQSKYTFFFNNAMLSNLKRLTVQVNEVFIKDLDNPKFWEADSLHYADERIVTEDLMKRNLSTNPKMIMFDACYNGSFHENDYIAGQYIFNDGQTLVAQGNTRNVLQDR